MGNYYKMKTWSSLTLSSAVTFSVFANGVQYAVVLNGVQYELNEFKELCGFEPTEEFSSHSTSAKIKKIVTFTKPGSEYITLEDVKDDCKSISEVDKCEDLDIAF